MSALILLLKQQIQKLEQQVNTTTNPIEYIKLVTQLGCTSEILQLAEQLIPKATKVTKVEQEKENS